MKRVAFVRMRKDAGGGSKSGRLLKTKQRHVTKAEKALWSEMAELGCIACRLDGNPSDQVSIHHIDGRTKPGCHQLVLPLCAGHHQDGTGEDKSLIAVHPHKARFEQRYGPQKALLGMVLQLLLPPARPPIQAPRGLPK